jgi:methylenetetrahydrofolate reductase (NADPH)
MSRGLASVLPDPGFRIADVLGSGVPTCSFEFFPPKDDEGERRLWQAIRRLEALRPTFVSVTYGAGGSTRDRTVRVTSSLRSETTLEPMGHLTCIGATTAQVRAVVGAYADAGVRNVLALRGDPPRDADGSAPEGDLRHATDLVTLVRELGDFCVGVAAFPDGHPQSAGLDADALVLAAKQAAGAEFAITQFFFDADAYFRLVERAAAAGATLPILPGIMPVTNVGQIRRFAELSGAALPHALVEQLQAVQDDPAAVRAVGVDTATDLCASLLAGGAPGLHFYTLNSSTATAEISARLGLAGQPLRAVADTSGDGGPAPASP